MSPQDRCPSKRVRRMGPELTREATRLTAIRLAASFIERIVTLNWEDISIADQVVVNLAGLPIVFEPPLDQIVRDLASSPGHDQTAAHPNTRWVFRSQSGLAPTSPPCTCGNNSRPCSQPSPPGMETMGETTGYAVLRARLQHVYWIGGGSGAGRSRRPSWPRPSASTSRSRSSGRRSPPGTGQPTPPPSAAEAGCSLFRHVTKPGIRRDLAAPRCGPRCKVADPRTGRR